MSISNQIRVIFGMITKLTYSSEGQKFEKQNKTSKKEDENQIKATKSMENN